MSVASDNPKPAAPNPAAPKSADKEKKSRRGFHSSDLAVPLFIFSAFGAAYLSGMTIVAATYAPLARSGAHFGPVYWPALLFLPCFLIALLRGRWASIPLWACCVALFVVGLMPSRQPAGAGILLQPGLGMVLIPALTEVARFLRGGRDGKHS
jgi:hypothetical protein